jgi:hypothetical protein
MEAAKIPLMIQPEGALSTLALRLIEPSTRVHPIAWPARFTRSGYH